MSWNGKGKKGKFVRERQDVDGWEISFSQKKGTSEKWKKRGCGAKKLFFK